MRIYQFVHTLNYGDAISGEALAIKNLLDKRSVVNAIYSVHSHEKVMQFRKSWHSFNDDLQEDIENGHEVAILLHYSIASLLNDLFVELKNVKRAIVYHNLTPPKWFHNYNSRVFDDLVRAREELPVLLEQADILVADSEFNRKELCEITDKEVEVVPLILDLDKWQVASNAGIAKALRSFNGTNILHVGRLAPNKCIEDIIKAFYFYHHKIEQNSRLWLIGIDIDTEIYSLELRRLVARLQLKEAVNFVGSVADSELRAFYENSDAYLCMSEHEGFCLPLVEAMHFGLPVIAYDSCAVKATVGSGGLVVAEKTAPEVAELIHIVCSEQEFRGNLIKLGYEQCSKFSPDEFARSFENFVLKQLDKSYAIGGVSINSTCNSVVST